MKEVGELQNGILSDFPDIRIISERIKMNSI